MAASSLAAEASSLFVDEVYDEALLKYTQAIATDGANANLLVQRSATLLKLERPTEAYADAVKALTMEPGHPKALLRKGMAAFALEEFATARTAFAAGAAAEPSTAAFQTWLRKCEVELDDEASDESDDAIPSIATPAAPPAAPVTAAPPAAPPPRFRHEWYQTQDKVTVSVFARGTPAADVQVKLTEATLEVTIVGEPTPYVLSLQLFGPVETAACKHSVLTSKVEVVLKKATAVQWTALEGTGAAPAAPQPLNFSNPAVTAAELVYPSSHTAAKQRAPTDWNKLEQELKEEEKDEKLEGDAALNKLFKDIYGNADEETRRAMNKSFAESNGTVLSTNWKDVGAKTVEGSPPSGMEVRKYEQ